MKTKKEVEAVLSTVETDSSRFPGMSYEQGVEEALRWVLGDLPDDEFSILEDA